MKKIKKNAKKVKKYENFVKMTNMNGLVGSGDLYSGKFCDIVLACLQKH